MNNTLLDNSEKFLMRDILRQFIGSGKYNHICIATGYWDLPGTRLVYNELKTFLEAGGRLDILIGQEPQLRSYQTQAPADDQKRFPDFYLQRDINLLTDEYRPTAELIQQFCNVKKYEGLINKADVSEQSRAKISEPDSEILDQGESQIQIRVFGQKESERKQFLHAKCYIFLGNGEADGIIGSSNFTEKGLEDNAELNYLETQNSIVIAEFNQYSNSKSHKTWFEEKWEQSEPWNGKFLKILSASPVGKPKPEPEPQKDILTPYEIYIKYLQTQFGDIADDSINTQIRSYIPIDPDTNDYVYKPYEFQLDAVKQCFHIMKIHGGFFLSDVVGLGKTIVGVLIIRRFIEEADRLGRIPNVLIVTPPAIIDSWKGTIRKMDAVEDGLIASHIDYITTGSIGKLTENIDDTDDGDDFDDSFYHSEYGLILIDESHNFRNKDNGKHKALEALIDSHPIDKRPYIALLSATPQNNSPIDIYNQISFFQNEEADSSLGGNIPGRDIQAYFNKKDKEFKALRKLNTPESRKELADLAKDIHDRVLQHIVVRRTRADIDNIPEYAKAGLRFPKIEGPTPIRYSMSGALTQLFADTVDKIIAPEEIREERRKLIRAHKPVPKDYTRIGYFRYAAINYFVDKNDKALYEKHNLTVEGITDRLAKLMQIQLVKRLESSFAAFRMSLQNLYHDTLDMIEMINANTVFICPDFDVHELIIKYGDLEKATSHIRNKIQDIGGNNREFTADRFRKDEFVKDLQNDIELIKVLIDRWEDNKEDPKFDEFKMAMKYMFFNPEINNPSKANKPRLVIFTESADTLDSLVDYIQNETPHRVLRVTSKTRNQEKQRIIENFDQMYEGEKKDDFDIILTTEVLAEGVNLHRSNVILNYDTPWNATRLMQRIGRVNRIGSQEECVHVFNFYPSKDGNQHINLYENALNKLQSFHNMFGEDNKVFSETEELSEADLHKIVTGDVSECAAFISELKMYAKNNPERYEFIKSLNLNETGGFVKRNDISAIFLIGAEGRQSVGIAITPEREAKEICPLTMMSMLKCDENLTFEKKHDKLLYEELYKTAIEAYSSVTNRSLRASTNSHEQKDAQKCIKEIRSLIHSPEGLSKLAAVDGAIRRKNKHVIKTIKRYAKDIITAGQTDSNFFIKTPEEAFMYLFQNITDEKAISTAVPFIELYEIPTR